MNVRILALVAAVLVVGACSNDGTSPVQPQKKAPTDRYVNQTTGDDANDGSSGAPWATLTHALATAKTGITIHVAPGTYSAANGETFPITMKPGQKLIGDVAAKGAGTTPTEIQGEAPYALGQLAGTAIVGAEGARVAGFSVANETNHTLYAGITVDAVTMEVDHNTFPSGMYAGVNAGNAANVDAHDNVFEAHSYGLVLDGAGSVRVHNNTMTGEAFGVRVFGIDSLEVANNTMSNSSACVQWGYGTWNTIHDNSFEMTGGDGSILTSGGTAVIRNNTFTGKSALYVQDAATPDAGTAASPGHNDFSAISGPAVQHTGSATVTAVGNTWAHDPPQAGVDYVITGSGTIVTE